ncbi:MAG: hydrogenase maturation nickel metallochaperone HypA [Betaproteobacteria bacterium]|jgi:hydrogenase nickel incorporation protein HypA/HybF|nr:hydrogenase maturation nickel metallochaperone HypA [Burkholderiaceae bacterium]
MHEMSLAEGLIQVVEEAAGARTVRTVRLEIGRLAAVELSALRFAFEVVRQGTVAQDAALDVVALPGQAWCMKCCQTVTVEARGDGCPRCGSHQLQVTGGDEMRVKELELA